MGLLKYIVKVLTRPYVNKVKSDWGFERLDFTRRYRKVVYTIVEAEDAETAVGLARMKYPEFDIWEIIITDNPRDEEVA